MEEGLVENKMSEKPQINVVREKRYFVCEYTGGPVEFRFFIPEGKKKRGCYATLPILLRHQADLLGIDSDAFKKVKSTVEKYFNQPDIPLAPPLEKDRIPLSEEQLSAYIAQQPEGQGLSWLLVKRSVDINDVGSKKKKLKSQ